jgi:hypothetical protein
MRGVRTGNAIVDGEVVGRNWKLALEIMSHTQSGTANFYC